MNSFAIFQKDTRILIRQMAASLALQGFLMVFVPILWSLVAAALNSPDKFPRLDDWFPMVQLSICGLVALIAAALWDVEERAGKNDLFLRRLPVSFLRIRLEKTAAGLLVVLITILIQWLWHVLAIHKTTSTFYFSVLFIGLYAYGVGLPLSRFFKQTINMILAGTLLVLIGFLMIGALLSVPKKDMFQLLTILGIVLVIILTIVVTYIIHRRRADQPKSRYELLVSTHRAENRVLFYISLGLLAGTITALFGLLFFMVNLYLPAIFLLTLAIGISTYNQDEKHGLGSVLYYQPLSLNELFWIRWLYGCFYCLLPVFCFIVLLLFSRLTIVHAEMGPMGHPIQAYFHTSLFGSVFLGSAMDNFIKIYPENHTFGLLMTLFCMGYIPFVCGLLFTHAIRNYVYAFLETILAVLIVASFCIWMIFSKTYILTMAVILQGTSVEYARFFPPYPWLLIALIAGLTLAAWRTATDREVLSSNTLHRQMYVGRLFLFTLAVIAVLFKTGWKDLFYLVTGFDIGIG